MNTHIQSPEIVVIGYNNANKAAIIEAFLGYVLVEAKDILVWRSRPCPHFTCSFQLLPPLLISHLHYEFCLAFNFELSFAVLC